MYFQLNASPSEPLESRTEFSQLSVPLRWTWQLQILHVHRSHEATSYALNAKVKCQILYFFVNASTKPLDVARMADA